MWACGQPRGPPNRQRWAEYDLMALPWVRVGAPGAPVVLAGMGAGTLVMAQLSGESTGWGWKPPGFPPSPCRGSAVPGLAVDVWRCSSVPCPPPAVPRAGGLAVLAAAGAALLLQQSARWVAPGHCTCRGTHPRHGAPGARPPRHAALLLPPCLSSACKWWIFINELPLLQRCYLKHRPINEAFGPLAA